MRERKLLERRKVAELLAASEQSEKLSVVRRRLRIIEKLRDRLLCEYAREAEKEIAATAMETHLCRLVAAREPVVGA